MKKKGSGTGVTHVKEIQDLRKALQTEQAFRKSLTESVLVGVAALDLNGRKSYVNPAFCRMTGWEEKELIGAGPPFVYWPPEERGNITEHFEWMIQGRKPSGQLELRFQRKNGERFDVLLLYSALIDGEGKRIGWLGSIADITESKEAERRNLAANALLELFSKKWTRKEYLDEVIALIKTWSESRCIGIRVLKKDAFVPYESYTGFSRQFWESESNLSIIQDQCVCTRVFSGKPDPKEMPVMTPHGSFYSEKIFEFVGNLSKEEQARHRGVCMDNGFASVAVCPIRYNGQVLAAIHLADERAKQISLKRLEFIEAMTPFIGEAIHRFNLEEKLMQSESRLRYLSSQLMVAQETERKRIAAELHDSIASSLGAIKFGIERTVDQMEEGEGGPGLLKNLIPAVKEAIHEVRRIMSDLRPSVLDDLGITATIHWFCREYHKTYSHIDVEQEIVISEEEVPDSLKTAIYRICQEAMNNVAKYSKASQVNLSLQKGESGIELAVQDNGQGFDVNNAKRGYGLSTMRERAELSGGTFNIESSIGKGTTLRVSWPFDLKPFNGSPQK